ncbi:MAG: hypothetical protein E6K13_09345 [Methanobacteriota archaeon]|nr:MAG: hypothetical protein E6K13_09345 [Euryarchaeota archaeon]
MPTISTDSSGNPHIAWSQSKSAEYEASAAYRSNTGTNTVSSPKTRNWDGTSWTSEVEQSTAGSPIRGVRMAWSPTNLRERIGVTQSDDGYLDAYVCAPTCTVTNDIGQVWSSAPSQPQKRFDIAYEGLSGDALLVYGVLSTDTTRDIAYRTYSGGSWSAEQYLDDTGHSTDVQYATINLASKKGSDQIALIGGDITNNDANAWIWDGSSWGSNTEITGSAESPDQEEIAIACESISGDLLAVSAQSGSTGVAYKTFTTSWSSSASSGCADRDPVHWLSLKANPLSTADDMVLITGDDNPQLSSCYWTGSAWANAHLQIGGSSTSTRNFDFAWEDTGSKGLLVYGSSGQITRKTFTAPDTWGSATNTAMGSNSHPWVTLRTNPAPLSGDTKILGAVMEATALDLGAVKWDGTTLTVIGASTLTADTGVTTYDSYDLEYHQASGGNVFYKNKAAGTWRATVLYGRLYTGISVDVSPQNPPNYVSLVRYMEGSTNEIQYAVCKDLSTSNCDATTEFTKAGGSAGFDTVATGVESSTYASLATTWGSEGDLWVAYAKDVDGTTRAIYARFLNYPAGTWATAETVDSLSGTIFTKPSIGLDKDSNVYALYVGASGPQVYYNKRSGAAWGTRTAVDISSDNPTLMVRSPTDATYGTTTGGLYWKTTTSETYFHYPIPEFESVAVPVGACILILWGFSWRAGRKRRPRGTQREMGPPGADASSDRPLGLLEGSAANGTP